MNMRPSDLFGAFANPTRLRILNLLQAEKEICVCDLCEVLGLLARVVRWLRGAGSVLWTRQCQSKPYLRLYAEYSRAMPCLTSQRPA